jgi:hypothetical protein
MVERSMAGGAVVVAKAAAWHTLLQLQPAIGMHNLGFG